MATIVSLAAGTTAATSSPMVIPAGTSAVIGISATGGNVLVESPGINLRVATNGDPTTFYSLDASNPCVLVQAPSTDAITVTAVRPAMDSRSATSVYIIQ
jgi:hypothetical protein